MQGIYNCETSNIVEMNLCEDLHIFISTFEEDNTRHSQKKVLQVYADIIHNYSLDEQRGNIDHDNSSAIPLETLGYSQSKPPKQLVRHPPPATGRDDDIDKLEEIVDSIFEKSGHDGNKGHRMLCAPDNKIGANLMILKSKSEKYKSIIPEFPVLHLRKSKITNLCSAYKDLGVVHMLLYMRDTKDVEWVKLIENAHIDQATTYVHRLSLALHMTFMVTFLSTLSQDECLVLMQYLATGLIDESVRRQFEKQYQQFIQNRK